MENIILTNNKDLRLVSVKVGVLSTLRFELPLVSASATHVEVIVTSGSVHSAYTATFIDATKFWQCDIAASQFPAVGKQSYEVAYVLDGKQFWDGKGWIEIEDATTSGIEPQPRPEPYRYTVLSVNGYGADAQGAVRIPMTFIATDSPATTEGYIEGDIYFNRVTGATWTLCNVLGTLTWVFNYKNYYTKSETDEQIDKLAAYYITSDVQGNPFSTRAALINAMAYYSGGQLRVPTRNDYAVVLADEAHGGAEWRYIYAVADGQTTGQWEAQYPIETNDYEALANKPQINGVTLSGNKSAADLGLASKSDVDPMLFAQYYPDGSVTSAAEFTQGIKYDAPDTTNRTITVKPFCNTGNSANDNSNLVGRVVIPPFVDASDNGYISDNGTRFKVVGVSDHDMWPGSNANLTAVVAPTTLTGIGVVAFGDCRALTNISLPAATSIGERAFGDCRALTNISLPAVTSIGELAISYCTSLSSVDFGDTPRPSVPSLGRNAFDDVPTTCKIIVPYTQYDAWIAASGWSSLPQEFVRHSEKADKPATFTVGNLAKFDANGNPVDSGKKPSDFQSALTAQQLANIAAVSDALAFDATHAYAAGDPVVYNGTLYTFTAAHTGTWTGSDVSAVDIIARLAGKLDKSGGEMTPTFVSGTIPSGKVVFGADAAGPYIGIALGQNVAQLRPSQLAFNDRNAALAASDPTAGNLAALDANGNPTDSGVKPSDKLDSTSAAPAFSSDSTVQYPVGSHVTYNGKLYKCTTATTGGTWVAASWTDDMASNYFQYALAAKTIINSEVTLDDRAMNAVAVSSSLASLTINFPTATSGKVRDFGLRLSVASGITTAPELVLPQGVTCENADGEVPEIGADGAATILYFTETAAGVFLVKGEVVTAIS